MGTWEWKIQGEKTTGKETQCEPRPRSPCAKMHSAPGACVRGKPAGGAERSAVFRADGFGRRN